MRITWLGHAAFCLTCEKSSGCVYIDPFLTAQGEDLSKHHPTAILVTHGHGDHVGDTLDLLRANPKAKAYAIVELAGILSEEAGKAGKGRIAGANKGGQVDLGDGWTAVLVDAKHTSSYNGRYAGEAAAWVVRAPDGTTVYHCGDTDSFAGMEDICEINRPEIALVPIGDFYTMGPHGAAYAVAKRMTTVKKVVPMHYKTFGALTGTPEEFKKELEAQKAKAELVVLEKGTPKDF